MSFLILFFLIAASCSDQKKITVTSPDGNIKFVIFPGLAGENNGSPGFALEAGNRKILLPSFIQINTGNVTEMNDFHIIKVENESVNNQWTNNFGEKKEVPDRYNQLKIFLKNKKMKINLICRAYDEGVAFAYEFPEQEGMDSVTITDEKILFRFPDDYNAWSAARAQAQYSHVPLSKIKNGCERPLIVEIDSTLIIALAEAKLVDYARMKFEPDTASGIAIRTLLGSEVIKSVPFSHHGG